MTNPIFTSKKIIAVVLCCILIFSNFLVVFADDDNSGLSPDPELSSSELEFLSAATSEEDLQIRQLSVDVVRATSSTYTLDDVYALLIALVTTQHNGMYEWKVYDNTIYNQINNNFSHYDSTSGNTYDTGSMLWTIRQAIMDLHANLTPAMGDTIYDLISNIDSMLSSFFQSFQSYDYTSALFFNSIGVAQYCSTIQSYLIDPTTNLSIAKLVQSIRSDNLSATNAIRSDIGSISTKITTSNSRLNDIITNTSNIKNSVDSVNTSLQSFNNDFNNINWTDISKSFIVKDSNFNDISVYNGYVFRENVYFVFNAEVFNDITCLKISIPLITNYNRNIDNIFSIGVIINNNFYSFDDVNYISAIDTQRYYYNLYISSFYTTYPNITIRLNYNNGYTYEYSKNNTSTTFSYITQNNLDFYIVNEYISNKKYYEYLKSFNNIYASEDLISAKENQQDFEDHVLEDFTGSGSAASSVSDVVSVKQISNTVSSGLNTGVGVSSVLSIFSAPHDDGDMFEWFTQSNYNQINNLYVYTPVRQEKTRSGSGSDILPDIFSWSVEETINNPNSRND